jgi:hypothetical protein
MEITAHMFLGATGRAPVDDDLERANCDKAGTIHHIHCGWCWHKNLPKTECHCVVCIMERNNAMKEG